MNKKIYFFMSILIILTLSSTSFSLFWDNAKVTLTNNSLYTLGNIRSCGGYQSYFSQFSTNQLLPKQSATFMDHWEDLPDGYENDNQAEIDFNLYYNGNMIEQEVLEQKGHNTDLTPKESFMYLYFQNAGTESYGGYIKIDASCNNDCGTVINHKIKNGYEIANYYTKNISIQINTAMIYAPAPQASAATMALDTMYHRLGLIY